MALLVQDAEINLAQSSRRALRGAERRVHVVVAVPPGDRLPDRFQVEVPATMQGYRFVGPTLRALPERLPGISAADPPPRRVAHDGAVLPRRVREHTGHPFLPKEAFANPDQQLVQVIPTALGCRVAGSVHSYQPADLFVLQ